MIVPNQIIAESSDAKGFNISTSYYPIKTNVLNDIVRQEYSPTDLRIVSWSKNHPELFPQDLHDYTCEPPREKSLIP